MMNSLRARLQLQFYGGIYLTQVALTIMRRSKPKGISRNIILLQYVERVEKEEDPTILPGKDPNPQWILD